MNCIAIPRGSKSGIITSILVHVPFPCATDPPSDILENNLKQVLSLLWYLILRYQVSETNKGSKTLLLDWVNATLPDKEISNFTTDWNDGIHLSALVDYCKPGLIPNHSSLDPSNATENISNAMALAEEKLGIPKLMQADDLAAESPDERSVITYLFLFCGPASPGQEALLSWIQKQIPSQSVTNFTTDWVNGEALGMLVNEVSVGAFPAYDQYKHTSKEDEVENCRTSMDAAKRLLEIESTLEAEEFANPELNPVSRATYLVHVYHAYLRPKVMDLHIPSEAGSGEMVWLDLVCPQESSDAVQGYAKGSLSAHVPVEVTNLAPNKFRLKFEAKDADKYTLAVRVNENRVKGSPFDIDLTAPDPDGVKLISTITPKKVGLPVSLLFDVSGAGRGEITAEAVGEKVGHLSLQIEQTSTSTREVSFIPFEGDVYTLEVDFAGKPVPGSPFVFPLKSIAQPNKVKCGEPEFSKPDAPVHLIIDTSNAGTGKLTAKCRGEKSGEIEVEFTGSQDTPNGLTFTPPAEDVYTLSIYFDDTEVNGSPFIINLHPAVTEVSLLEPPSGNLNVGDEIKISFDASKVGARTMTISCKANKVGEIPVTVVKGSRQNYDVVFIPPEEDVYFINILWAESHIQGSPFAINLIPKDDTEVVSPLASACLRTRIVSGSNSALYSLNKDISLETTMVGEGSFIVTETSQKGVGTTLYIDPIPEKPQVFKVRYIPATPGIHTFSILWAKEAIPSSLPSSEGTDADPVPLGIPIMIKMTAHCRKRHLKANAIHQEKNTQHKMKIDKLDKSHFHLTYKPKDEGVYHLHVLHQDKEFPGSPLKVECSRAIKATSKEDSHIDFVVDSLLVGLDDGDSGDLKQSTNVSQKGSSTDLAHTADKDSAPLNPIDSTFASIFSPVSRTSVSLTVLDPLEISQVGSPTDPAPTVQAQPTSASSVDSTPMSPIDTTIASMIPLATRPSVTLSQQTSVDVSQKSSAKVPAHSGKSPLKWGQVKEAVTGLSLEKEKFRVGKLYSFNLHCEELGTDTPEFACKPPTGAEINLLPLPGENSHRVEIIPKQGGKHELSVTFGGKHILGSPFNVQFRPRSDASKCVLKDSPPECQEMSTSAENTIFCVSDKGAGKGKLTAFVENNTTKETLPASITRPLKHHYHVEVSPSEGLDYTVTIKYDDIDIPGSPFKLGDATKCRIEGKGTTEAWLDEQSQFVVNAEEAGRGQLKVVVEGDSEIVDTDISMPAEAIFEVGYQPSRRGMYNVSVKWGNLDIPGSPFQVKCRKRIPASEIHITNPSAGAYIGTPLKLRLVAEGNEIDQEEKLAVFILSSKGEEFPGIVEKGDSGSCLCTIDPPPTAGAYELHVLWTGEHIPGSPFDLEVAQHPELSDFTVETTELEGGAMAVRVHGPKYAFRCGELKASVEDATTAKELPVTAVQLSHEEYNLEFHPSKKGRYLLSILYDDNHIHGSPFRLTATDASMCYTKGKGLTVAQVGEVTKFIVCTEKAGMGELTVNVERYGEDVKVRISAASENLYEVTYNPQILGIYKVSVQWDDKHIPGSPFEVPCVDATRYSVVDPPKETPLGTPIVVGVKVADDKAPAHENLEVLSYLKDGDTIKSEISETSHGNYACTILLPELRKYQIHVCCNGLDICGSPFTTRVMPAAVPENVRAYGEGLEDGVIGEERLFTVQVSDAGYGYLGFRIQGPKKGFNITSVDGPDEEGLISARYTPIQAGDYTISLLWSDVQIPGSPFQLSITNPDDSDCEVCWCLSCLVSQIIIL